MSAWHAWVAGWVATGVSIACTVGSALAWAITQSERFNPITGANLIVSVAACLAMAFWSLGDTPKYQSSEDRALDRADRALSAAEKRQERRESLARRRAALTERMEREVGIR